MSSVILLKAQTEGHKIAQTDVTSEIHSSRFLSASNVGAYFGSSAANSRNPQIICWHLELPQASRTPQSHIAHITVIPEGTSHLSVAHLILTLGSNNNWYRNLGRLYHMATKMQSRLSADWNPIKSSGLTRSAQAACRSNCKSANSWGSKVGKY